MASPFNVCVILNTATEIWNQRIKQHTLNLFNW